MDQVRILGTLAVVGVLGRKPGTGTPAQRQLLVGDALAVLKHQQGLISLKASPQIFGMIPTH